MIIKKIVLIVLIFNSLFICGQQSKIDSLRKTLLNEQNEKEHFKIKQKIIKLSFNLDTIVQKEQLSFFCDNSGYKSEKMKLKNAYLCNDSWGKYYYKLKKYNQSLTYYYKNLNKTSNADNKLNTYLNVVKIFFNQDCIDSTKYYTEKMQSLKLCNINTFNALFKLSQLYLNESRLKETIELTNTLTKIADTLTDNYLLGKVEYRRSQVYRKLKNYELAIKNAELANQHLDSKRNPHLIGANYTNLSYIYKNKKDYKNSLKYCDSAIIIYKKIGENTQRSVLMLKSVKATLYLDLNKKKEAIKIIEDVIKIQRESDNNKYKINLAYSLNKYGIIHAEIGNLDKSIIATKESLELAKKFGLLNLIRSTNYNLREFYYHKKDYKNAHKYLLNAFKIKDSILKINYNRDLLEVETKYQTEKKEKKLALQREEIQKQEIKTQKLYIYLGLVSFLGLLILSIFIFSIKQNKIDKIELNQEINLLKQKVFDFKEQTLKKENEFRKFLMKKYNLKIQHIETWEGIIDGFGRKEYAEKMNISENTIKTWRSELFKTLKKASNINYRFSDVKASKVYRNNLKYFTPKSQKKD